VDAARIRHSEAVYLDRWGFPYWFADECYAGSEGGTGRSLADELILDENHVPPELAFEQP
jgi:hypothetical protein